MQRYGKTAAGTERYYCVCCKISSIKERKDTANRHHYERFVEWITGKETLSDLGKKYGITRRALHKEFQKYFQENSPESVIASNIKIKILIVDAKYIHRNKLCVLVAVTENDQIFFQFALEESYDTWLTFLSQFPAPEIIVSDGQKGLRYVVKRFWPDCKMQRCHFHMVSLAIQYLSRNPKTQSGKEILHLLYELKNVKTFEERDYWITLFKMWEQMYKRLFLAVEDNGEYIYKKERSVKLIIRRALPNLFTYLGYPNVPNTTNLVEGWVNTAIAQGLRRHRGIHLSQKKALVSIILSNLSRNSKEKPTRKFP